MAVILRIRIVLVVLGSQEVRQHLPIAPTRISRRRPIIEVGWVSTEIDHAVDGARTADHVPARNWNRAASQVALRHRHELPVQPGPADGCGDGRRDVDERMPVRRTGFDHGHSRVRIFREPAREHATCRTGADNDIIEHVPLLAHAPSVPFAVASSRPPGPDSSFHRTRGEATCYQSPSFLSRPF
jgi:hypothetical protein